MLRLPHARIASIWVEAARAPWGASVLTAADYARERPPGHYPFRQYGRRGRAAALLRRRRSTSCSQPQPPLAGDRARYVGEPVALIVGETLEQARGAAEAVEIDHETLPAAVTIADALAAAAPQLWDGAPGNLSLRAQFGDADAVDRAFGAAALLIERDLPNQRIVNCQMEPRAAIGLYDGADDCYTLMAGSQGVVRHRGALSAALGVPPAKVRVVSPDVGGGFGSRSLLYPEFVLVVWAAKRIGRTVRWNSERSEAFLSDFRAAT